LAKKFALVKHNKTRYLKQKVYARDIKNAKLGGLGSETKWSNLSG
jgi:hypothetical protein